MGARQMMAKLQAAGKVSVNSLLKFRLEEVWPSVQSNALSRPRNACQLGSWLSGCPCWQGCGGFLPNALLQSMRERQILSKSVSELICPIFDLTRTGSRPSLFFSCAFKGL